MTPRETALLVRYIKSVSPAQAIDDYTYETWHDIIGHLEPDAARNAVIAIKHSQTFVDPSDIIREVERKQRRHAHPSERPVAEVIGAPAMPPNAEYLKAKAEMDEKMRQRAQAAAAIDYQTARRAEDWISYKLSGQRPMPPLSAPAAPRWVPLPGDPPELQAWLSRQPAEVSPD
jgi:hypothetical protein